MCVRCVDRYPQLQSINKQEGNAASEDVVPDRRRRASEISPPTTDNVQQQGPPPSRGRSDSLPSQKPRMQQRPQTNQSPQQRSDLPQHRQPNDMQGPRPHVPPQNAGPRPQHPQQVRPRHPGDQQKQHHGNGHPRPHYPNEQQRFPHPNEQRFPPPNGQIRAVHPVEQQQMQDHQHKKKQINDQQRQQIPAEPHKPPDHRSQHPQDIKNQNHLDQRHQQVPPQHRNPSAEQRGQNTSNSQRDQVSNDRNLNSLENRSQNDVIKTQNIVEQNRPVHPNDPRYQHQTEQQRSHQMDQPRSQHTNDQTRPRHQSEHFGPQLPLDQRNQQVGDPRLQYPVSQQPNQQRMPQTVDQKPHNIQSTMQKSQYHDEHYNSQQPQYPVGKDEHLQQQMHPLNDFNKPRPQHPTVQPPQKIPEGSVQTFAQNPPLDQEYVPQRPQGTEAHQMTPPPRNQRVRQPPEPQIIPRPQHPTQQDNGLVHYPQDVFKASNNHITDKTVQARERGQSKQFDGQPFPPENVKNGSNPYQQDISSRQHFDSESNQEECRRQDSTQKQFSNVHESLPHDKNIFVQRQGQNRQQAAQRPNETNTNLDSDKNDMYVSLSEQAVAHGLAYTNQDPQRQFQQQHQNVLRNDNSTSLPPATLPRSKPPEAPQPASRTKRDKPMSNQTLPRTGTNPFRTDTNPFRRESLPTETIDAGEYVTVAPRRGSLDDKTKLMSTHEQNRLNDLIKVMLTFIRCACKM